MYKSIVFDLGGVMVDFAPRAYLVDRICNEEIEEQVYDLTFDPATARLQSLILLGRPRLFGLLGRDDSLTIPWQEIETIGTDAVLVHTALPEAPPQPEQLKWWQKLRVKLGL